MTSQMSVQAQAKVLKELVEHEGQLKSLTRYYTYIQEEYPNLRKERLKDIQTAQEGLDELDKLFKESDEKLAFYEHHINKCKRKQGIVRDSDGKRKKYLRLKQQLMNMEKELAICS